MNVKEFAARAGISAHTIRYYDKLGLFGSLARSDSGHRRFVPQDLAWLWSRYWSMPGCAVRGM